MSFYKKLFYLFLPIILGSIVGVFIYGSIDYNILIKPLLSPPSWLFPVMWSIIYLLMGISYYIFKKYGKDNYLINVIYYLQLFINLFWSIIFFNLKLRFLAVLWIVLLDILVFCLIWLFIQKNKVSAYLNIIYFVWILFATYLTIGIFLLN